MLDAACVTPPGPTCHIPSPRTAFLGKISSAASAMWFTQPATDHHNLLQLMFDVPGICVIVGLHTTFLFFWPDRIPLASSQSVYFFRWLG